MSALAGNSDRMGSSAMSPVAVIACPAGAIVLIQGALRSKRNVVLRRRITDSMLGGQPC
jgi:hypothetical protein